MWKIKDKLYKFQQRLLHDLQYSIHYEGQYQVNYYIKFYTPFFIYNLFKLNSMLEDSCLSNWRFE